MRYEKKIVFKTDQELSDYLFISATFRLKDLRPYIETVQESIIEPLIGAEQLNNLLDAYYSNENNLDENQKQLLHYLRFPIAGYAFQKYIPLGQIDISTAGFRINNTAEYKTAFQWQIDELEFAIEYESGRTIENALFYLNKNKLNLPLYHNSPEFNNNYKYFINSVAEFDKYHNMRGHRRMWLNILYIQETVEDIDLCNILGKALYDDLKYYNREGHSGVSVSGSDIIEVSDGSDVQPEANIHYANLLKMIRFIVANLTFYRAVNELNLVYDKRGFLQFKANNTQSIKAWQPAAEVTVRNTADGAKAIADKYTKLLKDYLLVNALEIPLYVVLSENAGYGRIKNADENGFFAGLGTHK